jgi:hypothetical protein
VLTNALILNRPGVMDALRALDNGPYEIWAKLDGGTQDWFEKMAGRKVSIEAVTDNILTCARDLEVIIQSLVPTLDGQDPGDDEIKALGSRVEGIRQAGGRLRLIQLYTTARKPSNARIDMIEDARLDEMGELLRQHTEVPVEVFYGRHWDD